MVRIRDEQIDELKHPQGSKNDNFIQKLNCHNNPNKWRIHNSSNVYEDDDDNTEGLNFTAII